MGLLRTGWETKRAQLRTSAIVPVLTSYSTRRSTLYCARLWTGIGDSGTQSFVSVEVLYREDSCLREAFQDFLGSMHLARVVGELVFLRIGLGSIIFRGWNIILYYKWNGKVPMPFFVF